MFLPSCLHPDMGLGADSHGSTVDRGIQAVILQDALGSFRVLGDLLENLSDSGITAKFSSEGFRYRYRRVQQPGAAALVVFPEDV